MVYQLKIKLLNVKKPSVWRRILIDADITFDILHLVVQRAMGWGNSHLFSFGYKAFDSTFNIAIPYPDDWEQPTANAIKTKVRKYLNQQYPRMKYVYDFGDSWIHDVVLENVFEEAETGQQLPVCVGAKGACPPEDCGGVWGYEGLKMLAIKNNPTEEDIERLEWYGMDEGFDPKEIDIEYINKCLKPLHQKPSSKRKIDRQKQAERAELLKKQIQGISNIAPHVDKIVHHAFKVIDLLIENEVNIASGRPEIWAAAIVVFAQEDLFMDLMNNTDVYDYFGVKAAGVRNRINTIYDSICDEDYLNGWDDDEEYIESKNSYVDPIQYVIDQYKAGNLELPPDLEKMMNELGLM